MAKNANAINYFSPAKWVVSTVAGEGTHTTIAAALSAASAGDTIWIMPGTYTENLTFVAGVNLSAAVCDATTPNVTILGKCTFTGTGTVSCSGINFKTNSDYCIAVTGSSASVLTLTHCNINANNNTAINYTSSNSSASLTLSNCTGNISTTGIAYFTNSSNGLMSIFGGYYTNTGGSSTPSSVSGSNFNYVLMQGVYFANVLSTSVTGYVYLDNCNISDGGTTTTALTTAGTGNSYVVGTTLTSGPGTSDALSIGAGTAVYVDNVSIDCKSPGSAIDGAGTCLLGSVSFINTGFGVSSSTVSSRQSAAGSLTLNTALTVANGGTGAATLTGLLKGNGTSAITATAITQYNVLTGGASNAPNSVAPSATSGIPLISQGSSAQPIFGTTVVAGGGTGATTLTGLLTGNGTSAITATAITQYNVLTGGASNAPNSVAPSATSGVPLISQGSSAQPIFGTVGIAGGGTNATSFTQSSGIVAYNGTSLVNYSGPRLSSSGYYTNSSQPCFMARINLNQTNATGDGTSYTVTFDTSVFDQASNFNTSTYTFTAPVAGNYLFIFQCSVSNLSAAFTTGAAQIVTTARTYRFGLNIGADRSASGNFTAQCSAICPMALNDTASCVILISGGTKVVTVNGGTTDGVCFFEGCLLC